MADVSSHESVPAKIREKAQRSRAREEARARARTGAPKKLAAEALDESKALLWWSAQQAANEGNWTGVAHLVRVLHEVAGQDPLAVMVKALGSPEAALEFMREHIPALERQVAAKRLTGATPGKGRGDGSEEA